MRRSWRIFCSILALFLVRGQVACAQDVRSAPVSDESADHDKQKLRELVKQASAAYARSDWEAAREAYSQLWRMKPHALVAANLADVATPYVIVQIA